MKVTLVGVKDVKAFKSREGDTIDGVKLFIAYPDSGTVGSVCESKFVDRNVFDSFGVSFDELTGFLGTVINVEFSPNKKVVGLTV